MHIPDNYLSPSTCAVLAVAAVPVWAHSVKKLKAELPKEKVAMLGVGAAFSFVAMMFNIPMPGGTTGHAVGGTLIALLLGPEAACIAVTVALLIQALLFGDGGILAFGANCFNIAFLLPYVGYYTYKLCARVLHADELGAKSSRNLIAIGIGSYVGINVAALATAIEFGIQPALFHTAQGVPLYCPYGLNIAVPAMMLGHLTVFGAVEVIFTIAVYSFISNTSPSLIKDFKLKDENSRRTTPLFGLLAILIAATPLGLLAQGTAWGEWEISEIPTMKESFSWNSLLPDYSLAGLPDVVAYILSATIGVLLLIIIFRLISAGMKRTTDFGDNPNDN